ncbi:DUF362 domain-containing protein [Patescibacteria group bacterium]
MVAKTKVQQDLKSAVQNVINELGGISKFISRGDVVLLKPNFNTADEYPGSSSLDFVRVMAELCYEAGAKSVIIGDSCTMTQNSRRVMENLGVFKLQEEMRPSPRVLVFEEREWVKKEVPGGKYLKNVTVPVILDKIDKLILLPCLKTHFQAQYTGALKLGVAFMKPWERVGLHARKIEAKIAELNLLYTPDLVVMDARKCFIAEGPMSGPTEKPDLILASPNRVELDIEGMKIIQSYKGNSLKDIQPEELPQIKRAIEVGIK